MAKLTKEDLLFMQKDLKRTQKVLDGVKKMRLGIEAEREQKAGAKQ